MQHVHRITGLTALALGITSALAFGQVHASGFQLREASVKNLGRAQAGTAVARDDASVVSYNPAAMSNLDKTTVQADITVIDLTAEFSGGGNAAAGTPLARPLTGGNGGDPGEPTAVPAMAIVIPMHGALEGLTFGASISAPFGLKTEYDPNWVGRYHAVTSDVETVDLTLSAALKLHDRFSLGLGFIYERAEATLTNAVDFGSAICRVNINACLLPTPATAAFGPQRNDGFFEVHGDDTGIGWLFGAQWQPTDKLAIGFSHRSEIDHELEGDLDFTVPGAVVAAMGPGAAAFADGPGGANLTTPSTDTLSVRYDFSDSFRMMADVQQTDWHSVRSVLITRTSGQTVGHEAFNWKDSTLYALGAEFDLSDAITLRSGVAMDESPTNDTTRSPRLPDNERRLYAMGLTWNASPSLSIDASYQRIEIDDPTVNLTSASGSHLTGEYSGHADLFGVAAQYRF
ncbi:MAG: OmpP1/FadL family transporter [Lysobacter sp.]